MKSRFLVGLIIALAVVAVTGSAQADTTPPVKKGQQSKKHSSKKHKSKGKRVVVKKTAVKTKASKKSDDGSTAKLQTDINFNDSVLHGRYQTPDEATAKVENEKVLSDLLAVRTNFKDRLKKASEQN